MACEKEHGTIDMLISGLLEYALNLRDWAGPQDPASIQIVKFRPSVLLAACMFCNDHREFKIS